MRWVWAVLSVLLVIGAGFSGHQHSYTSLGISLALASVCALVSDYLKREQARAYREQVWARRDAANLKPIWPAEIGAPE